MPGFLNDLNLKDVPEDPNEIPVGKWPARLTAIKIQDGKHEGDRKACIFTYQIEPDHAKLGGRTKSEFKTIPNMRTEPDPITGTPTLVPDGPDDERHASYLKQRIMSFGVPESQLDLVEITDLTGTPVTINVAQRGDYKNIVGVQLREETSVSNISSMI